MNLGPFELGRVYKGDSRDLIRRLPERCLDAVVTDPPYSSGGMFRGDRAQDTTSKYVQTGQKTVAPEFDGDSRDQRSFLRWSEFWLRSAYHRTKPGGLVMVFTDWRQLPSVTDAVQMAGWLWRGVAVWDKTEGVRPMLGRFRSQAEFIVWGSRGALPLIGPTAPGVFRYQPRGDGSDHQTAKPVPMMEWLLSIVPAGGLVLDAFAGGGATGVACKRTGRQFLGFELSEFWTAYANRRLGSVDDAADTPLFSGQPSLLPEETPCLPAT